MTNYSTFQLKAVRSYLSDEITKNELCEKLKISLSKLDRQMIDFLKHKKINLKKCNKKRLKKLTDKNCPFILKEPQHPEIEVLFFKTPFSNNENDYAHQFGGNYWTESKEKITLDNYKIWRATNN